jgi:hypothetical protein
MRLLLFLAAAALHAQNFSERGYLETTAFAYPQEAPNDSAHFVGEALFRYEAFYKLTNLRFAAAVDARTDTHLETQRDWGGVWWDRTRQRPLFAVRGLSATYTRGRLTVQAGKQLIRWGKADVFTPTDRFAPRDYLNVVDTGFLPVTAARVTYGTQADTLDLILSPRLTPSRVPLLNQRWAVLPQGIPVHELDPAFPGGPQFGARWNHIGATAEYSLSFYNGYDNLPLFHVKQNSALGADAQRFYPQMRMYGADAAAPVGPVTLKGEAAYFTSTNPEADDYALFVLQIERQAGEWSLVAGYAGDVTTEHRGAPGFSPVRGLARSIVAHAGYTIDVNRSLAFEAVVHQNGQGLYAKAEYSQAFGQHWRATAGLALLRGDPGDFLGQYRLNSHAILTLRYSF